MSWFPDMATACMIAYGDHVWAIGWLSDKHPFPTGETPPEFLPRLKELCRRWADGLEPLAWWWSSFLGSHRRELCGRSTASGNIGVPAGDVLFAAPEMVAHYIEAHRYAPPAEFDGNAPNVRLYVAAITPLSNSTSDAWAVAYNSAIPGIVAKYKGMGDNVTFVDMHSVRTRPPKRATASTRPAPGSSSWRTRSTRPSCRNLRPSP